MEQKRNDNKSDDEKIRVWIAKNIIYCKKYDLFFKVMKHLKKKKFRQSRKFMKQKVSEMIKLISFLKV